ncbi:MAG: sulfatase [Candidatus Latescibacteria bacterium]|nr:sulfatase [Candidatus Latescibacterota bacterium]
MPDKINILVLAIDSLRADHLGCYGESRPLTPVIDGLAVQGTLWEQCFAPGIPTHPSFTTLYTGLHPLTHNIVCHGGQAVLEARTPLLPELLLQAGYTTCAIDNLGWGKYAWFNRGYEYYLDPSRRQQMPLMVSAEALNQRAIQFLRGHAQEPFFLLVHYWDVHTPYLPPEPYRRRFYQGGDPADPANHSLDPLWQHPLGKTWQDTWFRWVGGVTDSAFVDALYAGALNYLDEQLGRLLGELASLGLEKRTLVVLMADHGESLTEHGIFYDHHGLYDCCLHVPLILRWPGRALAGSRRAELAQHLDLTPTLLAAAGVEVPAAMEGNDLLAADRQPPGQVLSAENTWQSKWSLRTADHKFILARRPDHYGNPYRELYDLHADPGEARSLAAEQPDLCAELEAELEGLIRRRLETLGRAQDPLLEQDITLGKRWGQIS